MRDGSFNAKCGEGVNTFQGGRSLDSFSDDADGSLIGITVETISVAIGAPPVLSLYNFVRAYIVVCFVEWDLTICSE